MLKSHFITCLCEADPKYPAKDWDIFLPQATLTSNLLQNCRFNPNFSVYADIHGIFNYNKTPLEPLGTRSLFHEKTTTFCTWEHNGTDRWYIEPDLEHYWCVECYIPSNHSTCITDTVEFLPIVVPLLKTIS